MKFTCTVNIDQPRDKVVQLFVDPENLKEYQDGFLGKELLEGQAGQAGAISKMLYKQGKGQMELIETIIDNSLPNLFLAKYHHKHMDNVMKCRFVALNDNQTRYEYEYEYTRINWILPKLMAIVFPGMYRRQGEKWMKQFKEFAEKG